MQAEKVWTVRATELAARIPPTQVRMAKSVLDAMLLQLTFPTPSPEETT